MRDKSLFHMIFMVIILGGVLLFIIACCMISTIHAFDYITYMPYNNIARQEIYWTPTYYSLPLITQYPYDGIQWPGFGYAFGIHSDYLTDLYTSIYGSPLLSTSPKSIINLYPISYYAPVTSVTCPNPPFITSNCKNSWLISTSIPPAF